MANFLNKKEQVIDFQLTPHGRRSLSTGKLKPTYYAFYDDGVIYDSGFAGFDEEQNDIHPRIKNNTSYTKGVLSFEEIENSEPPGNYLEVAYGDSTAMSTFDFDISPIKRTLQTNKFTFDSAIGDAMFEGKNTQSAPAWKVVTCQGEILSASLRDTSKYDFTHVELDNEAREFNIPQIEVGLYYTKLIDKPTSPFEYSAISDSVSETPAFADGYSIRLVRDDLVVYAEEVNTQILTENFDIEVFHMEEESGVRGLSTGTITLNANIQPAQYWGKTITINDGINTVTFEFVQDLKNPTGPQNVGVIVPTAFEYLGDTSQSTQIFGAMYNLMAAIDDAFDNNYPTSAWYFGSNELGFDVNFAGKCTNNDEQIKCIRKVAPPGHINVTVGSVPPPVMGVTLGFTITNLNVGKNGAITTDYSDGVTVTGFSGAESYTVTNLERKFFEKEIPQIVDGLMTSRLPKQNLNIELNTDAVEYYFDVLTDTSVDAKIACECASAFNKNSYYIDIDFDEEVCAEAAEALYYDIYGSVTVPEICADSTTATAEEQCEDEL
jgi:hypothetical protein